MGDDVKPVPFELDLLAMRQTAEACAAHTPGPWAPFEISSGERVRQSVRRSDGDATWMILEVPNLDGTSALEVARAAELVRYVAQVSPEKLLCLLDLAERAGEYMTLLVGILNGTMGRQRAQVALDLIQQRLSDPHAGKLVPVAVEGERVVMGPCPCNVPGNSLALKRHPDGSQRCLTCGRLIMPAAPEGLSGPRGATTAGDLAGGPIEPSSGAPGAP